MAKAVFLKEEGKSKKDEFKAGNPVYCFTNAKRGTVVRTFTRRNRQIYVVRFQLTRETASKPATYEEVNCFRDELDLQIGEQKSVA